MAKLFKLIILCLTFWPIVYFGIFALAFWNLASNSSDIIGYPIKVFHITTMTIMLFLLVYYSIHLYKNRRLNGESKMLWTLGFVLLSPISMLVYWIKHIW